VIEATVGAMSSRTWRIARWLLAALIVVVGVVAFLAVKATLAVLAELSIGFWAAGPWHLSALRLVAWVAAGMLLHGIDASKMNDAHCER
jgi:hypothetical protein